MSDHEVEEISATEMAISEASTSKGGKARQRKPSRFPEEWVKTLPGSTNANSADEHIFFDPYAKCRDARCPDANGGEPFYYFYCNREKKVPVCNPWKKNLAKLIVPEVFLDIDLMKACFNVIILSLSPFTGEMEQFFAPWIGNPSLRHLG